MTKKTQIASQSFSKFIRPEEVRRGQITDRDLDILAAVLRYRFCSAAQLIRLAGGDEHVIYRRLRCLWEWKLLNRWAFPDIRTHSEFHYYRGNRAALDLLGERGGLLKKLRAYHHLIKKQQRHKETFASIRSGPC